MPRRKSRWGGWRRFGRGGKLVSDVSLTERLLSRKSLNVKRKITSAAPLEQRILTIRGEKVILDLDLAAISGVTTKQ